MKSSRGEMGKGLERVELRSNLLWSVFCFLFINIQFFNSNKVFAQGNSLSGIVTNHAGKVLPGASVLLNKSKFNVKTDSFGRFEMKDVPNGKYELVAFAIGTKVFKYEIVVNGTTNFSFNLLEMSTDLNPIEVQAEREETFGLTRMKGVENFGIYEGRKTEVVVLKDLTANLSTNNPRQVYSKVTGLNIWESDGAGLQLGIGGRGLSPNRTANFNVRQNGYDISADALGYPESYYTPPTEALERIEIVRGAASLQFGTQFGGLLNFRFQKGPVDKRMEINSRQTVGSWGFFNSFNAIGGTVANGKLNYYAYTQYKRGDGYRKNAGFQYGNFYAAFDYKLSSRLGIQLEITKMAYEARQPGGLTDKNFDDNPRQSIRNRNWFLVDWNMIAVSGNYQIGPNTKINVRNFGLLASRKALGNLERINVIDFGGERTMIDGKFANLANETRILHNYKLNGDQRHTFLVGTRLYQGNTTAKQGNGSAGSGADFRFLHPDNPENSDYRFPNLNFAAFAENIFNVTDQLSITPGIRFEYINTSSNGFYNIRAFDGAGNLLNQQKVSEQLSRSRKFVIAGLGLSYKPDLPIEFYANFSQNYRAINFSDLRIVNPNFIVDPNIQDERGFTADMGVKGKKNGRLMYELTAFYVFYKGKIGQILRADRPPLYVDYRYRGNIADARNLGLEMFGELELLNWKAQPVHPDKAWKLSIFTNLALVDARYINTQDATIKNKMVEMVPPVLLRTGTALRKGRFASSLQFSYASQHFSDATNAKRTATAVEGIIPSYSVVDLSMRYQYKRFAIEASLNNVLNQAYFTRRAEAYPGPGIIPADGRGYYITLIYRN